MFRKGGIFAGLGATDAPNLASLMIPLTPAAGKGVPVTSMLQGYLKATGNPKLVVDGQWGQCSHNAFTRNLGVPPSAESVAMLLQLDKFGVPTSNVQVWKPTGDQTCYSKTDAYEAPPVEQQIAAPEPAILLAKLFGVTPPAGVCPTNMTPDVNSGRCVCGPGFYQNPNTGDCVQTESPGKIDTTVTPKTGTPSTGSGGTRIVAMSALPKFSVIGASTPQQVKPGTTTLKPTLVGSNLRVVSPPMQRVMPGQFPTPVAPGMSPGAKVAIGVVAVGALGLAAWFLLRNKDEASGLTPNCGWRRNCGE